MLWQKLKNIIPKYLFGILIGGILFISVLGRFYTTLSLEYGTLVLTLLIALSVFILTMHINIAASLESLSTLKKKEIAKPILNPEDLYKHVAETIMKEAHKFKDRSIIRLGSLHNVVGHKKLLKSNLSKIYKNFDEKFTYCVKKSGPNGWEIRQVLLITDKDRLSHIVDKLMSSDFQKAKNFTLKVFIPPFSVPFISPLIIGNENGYLSYDEKSEFRVKAGIHLYGEQSVKFLIEYFDSIWTAPGSYELRSPTHINELVVEEIKSKLDEL